jgi:hypothetical protein
LIFGFLICSFHRPRENTAKTRLLRVCHVVFVNKSHDCGKQNQPASRVHHNFPQLPPQTDRASPFSDLVGHVLGDTGRTKKKGKKKKSSPGGPCLIVVFGYQCRDSNFFFFLVAFFFFFIPSRHLWVPLFSLQLLANNRVQPLTVDKGSKGSRNHAQEARYSLGRRKKGGTKTTLRLTESPFHGSPHHIHTGGFTLSSQPPPLHPFG